MDMGKRYCQNRQRKRKRTVLPSPNETKRLSPEEEERQYKLRRFVEDVGKFLSEKDNSQGQKAVEKEKTKLNQKYKAVKKVSIPKPTVNRCLFQHGGMQTKFCTRRGVMTREMTREMTARLDENLHKIISLDNKNQCNHHCHGTSSCDGVIREQSVSDQQSIVGHGEESQNTSVLRTLHSSCEDPVRTPASLSGVEGEAASAGGTRSGKSLSELDKELYPLFARVVSISCTQTKSKLFKHQSYVSAVKRKLQQIYIDGINKNIQDEKCGKELKKQATNSVGTPPFLSSDKTPSSHPDTDPPFKLNVPKVQFQSTIKLLEETIGPSSSSSKQTMSSPQRRRPHIRFSQPSTSLLSPPVVECKRPKRESSYLPKVRKYVHEPFVPSSPSITPLYNFRSKVFDGSGDGFHFNHYNSFLPPIEEEEDSPDFRYYPRKIF